ncbi:hypothetical protein [Neisseria sp. Ec49-e6-T10]|uniref:hypothetical protein n=1 Tax=Neisseria sp. Ec49-e6-T10 TaxID=3140744 RepID=UPI003EBC00A9
MQKKINSFFIGIVSLLFSVPSIARFMTNEPIICQNNIEKLQQNASTAYLVELSNVKYGNKSNCPLNIIGDNGLSNSIF